jgi:hypothetical protein
MDWRIIVLVVLGLAGGINWWLKRAPADPAQVSIPADIDKGAFIPVEMPGHTPVNTVLVLAPPNCPSERAQRADALVRALQAQGIPVTRGSSVDFSLTNPTAEQRAAVDRTVAVLRQGAPAVFINGMGMSDPSFAQVAAIYEQTRQ